MPDCRITSDFIVGFPTESEEEFLHTMSLVEEVRFDSIFAFMYSPSITSSVKSLGCDVIKLIVKLPSI